MSSIQSLLYSNYENEDSLEDNALFTPDLDYYTPLTTTLTDVQENIIPYRSQTLLSMNKIRCTILPMFLPSSFMSKEIISSFDDMTLNLTNDEPLFLLTNVPVQQLNSIQQTRRQMNGYDSTFELTSNYLNVITTQSNSFIISIYHQLLLDLSLRWNINISILDYNLAQLRTCAQKCREQFKRAIVQEEQTYKQCDSNTSELSTFTIEELPLALEFYLQIDVDMFYMKTCTFRQAQVIQQHIFCSNEPQAHYGINPCHQESCHYCNPMENIKLTAIHFQSNQIHQFINGYRAILNCPVTCETKNIIYVLICPCAQMDYIGYTSMSFRDCLAYHRDESNRIIREFLIGGITTNRIRQGIKSDQEKRNDNRLLYQHLTRCSVALQLFLNAYPEYWCLVPMKVNDRLVTSTDFNQISQLETSNRYNHKRLNALAKYLADGVSRPPFGYMFPESQIMEQIDFFRNKKHQLQSSSSSTSTIKNIDLFQAKIVAVLPEYCSTMLYHFVTTLLTTHAECKLNEWYEKIVNEHIHHQYLFHGIWCENLIRSSP